MSYALQPFKARISSDNFFLNFLIGQPDKKLQLLFRNIFGQMLPGITSKLIKLIQDGALVLKAKSLALQNWTSYVTAILRDEEFLQPVNKFNDTEEALANLDFTESCVTSLQGEKLNLTRDHISNHYKGG